jgi:hypothetical protein
MGTDIGGFPPYLSTRTSNQWLHIHTQGPSWGVEFLAEFFKDIQNPANPIPTCITGCDRDNPERSTKQ